MIRYDVFTTHSACVLAVEHMASPDLKIACLIASKRAKQMAKVAKKAHEESLIIEAIYGHVFSVPVPSDDDFRSVGLRDFWRHP